MVRLYTGNGDDGCTETLGGGRILKCDVLIELIGTLDEFSACLGLARAHTKNETLIGDAEALQKQLISVMGELAGGAVSVTEKQVKMLEEMTDNYCIGFEGFSVAGANVPSAFFNLARCVVRRGECIAVKAYREQKLKNSAILAYLNRLSDLMYAMSRYSEDNI